MFAMESAHDADIQGGTLLTAFPTAGMVRTIATDCIAEFLKMQRVAYVLSDDIPPAAMVQEGASSRPRRIVSHKKVSVLVELDASGVP